MELKRQHRFARISGLPPSLLPGLGAIAAGILIFITSWIITILVSAPRNIPLVRSGNSIRTSQFTLWKSYGYDFDVGITPRIDPAFARCATAPGEPLLGAHCCAAPFLGEAHWILAQRGQVKEVGTSGEVNWCDRYEHSSKLWARAGHFVADAGRQYALEITFPNAGNAVVDYQPEVRVRIASDWMTFIGILTSALVLAAIGIGAVQTGIALRQFADRKAES